MRRRTSRISSATGTNTTRLLGITSNARPDPIVRRMSGTPAPVWTDWSCHTFENPSTTKLMPSVTISGWTRKTPTPIPLTRPASAATASATAIPCGTPPGEWIERRGHEAGHRRDGADRQVDAAGQHRQRLAAGEDGERDGRRAGSRRPRRRHDARARRSPSRARAAPAGRSAGRSGGRGAAAPDRGEARRPAWRAATALIARLLRIWMTLPTINDADQDRRPGRPASGSGRPAGTSCRSGSAGGSRPRRSGRRRRRRRPRG